MMVASILQIVTSVTPSRMLWNSGGSSVATSKPAGRGRLISSSTVDSTMPAPKSCPSTTFFPTLALSSSCPVFTGQRSTPGLSTSGFGATASLGSCLNTPSPAAALIVAATSLLTTGNELTAVNGPPSDGGVGGRGPGFTGGAGAGVTGVGGTGPMIGPGTDTVPAFEARPNTT